MYAVIRTGGKQYRVEEGEQLEVEQLGADAGGDVELTPVLVVDGSRVLATPDQLGPTRVSARVVDPDVRGPKIRGFTYKSKSNQRRRWGHRQQQSLIEITKITPGSKSKAPAKSQAKAVEPKADSTKQATTKQATAKQATAKQDTAKPDTAKPDEQE